MRMISGHARAYVIAAGLLLAPLVALAQGTVQNLSGTLSVTKSDGTVRLLSEKSQVVQGDVISTAPNSYAQVKFSDGGQITLRPDTQIKIEGYSFTEAQPQQDNFLVGLLKGSMRMVTGLVGKRGNRDAFKLQTATATIGIRGTTLTVHDVPAASGTPAGVYVTVTDGSIALTSGGVEQLVATGQTGFSSSAAVPPQIVPPPPTLPAVTPPRSFLASGQTAIINAASDPACIIQ
jgi:hypothetical protein